MGNAASLLTSSTLNWQSMRRVRNLVLINLLHLILELIMNRITFQKTYPQKNSYVRLNMNPIFYHSQLT